MDHAFRRVRATARAALGRIYFPVAGICAFVGGYFFAQIANGLVPLIPFVLAASLGASAILVWLRFSAAGRRTLASRERLENLIRSVPVVLCLVGFATAGFALLTATLYRLGVGSAKGGHLTGTHVVDAAYSYYLWHLADAIPVLKVPENTNWKLEHPFTDSVNGSLVLVYIVLIGIPLVYTGTQVLKAWTADPEPAAADAGQPASSN